MIVLTAVRICILHLPGVAWSGLIFVYRSAIALPSLIRVSLALRSIRIADEKRRRALRWKPEGRRKP
jgi:hypothetical protein